MEKLQSYLRKAKSENDDYFSTSTRFCFDTARFALRGELVAGHESQSSLTVGLGAVDGI